MDEHAEAVFDLSEHQGIRQVRASASLAFRLCHSDVRVHTPDDLHDTTELSGLLIGRQDITHEERDYECHVLQDADLNVWFLPLDAALVIESEQLDLPSSDPVE